MSSNCTWDNSMAPELIGESGSTPAEASALGSNADVSGWNASVSNPREDATAEANKDTWDADEPKWIDGATASAANANQYDVPGGKAKALPSTNPQHSTFGLDVTWLEEAFAGNPDLIAAVHAIDKKMFEAAQPGAGDKLQQDIRVHNDKQYQSWTEYRGKAEVKAGLAKAVSGHGTNFNFRDTDNYGKFNDDYWADLQDTESADATQPVAAAKLQEDVEVKEEETKPVQVTRVKEEEAKPVQVADVEWEKWNVSRNNSMERMHQRYSKRSK